ncbi:hypothetical protein TrVGV298_001701 [Trichoderma virens]|nr:hypothetical protein TrVGV298_001701 [Trichoderma virens]
MEANLSLALKLFTHRASTLYEHSTKYYILLLLMLGDHMRETQQKHLMSNLDEGDAALLAHGLAAVPGRLLTRYSPLRGAGTSTARYERWYSWRDQMYLDQYKAGRPRRAFIRWVPDLTFSSRKASTEIRQRNFWLFASFDQGLLGLHSSGRWGKGGLAAVKGPQGIQRYSKPLLLVRHGRLWWQQECLQGSRLVRFAVTPPRKGLRLGQT